MVTASPSRSLLTAGFFLLAVIVLTSGSNDRPSPPIPAAGDVISMEDATEAASKAALQCALPLEMNDSVLKRLNEFLGTASGRAIVFRGWRNAKIHRSMINSIAHDVGVPQELIAVAIIESGLQATIRGNGVAGMWQLTPESARGGGLIVKVDRDDRLDPQKSTRSAFLLLRRLHHKFGGWPLALRAWNEGEGHVANLMEKHSSTDGWQLERAAPSRHHFLASVTALVIILKNPELMDLTPPMPASASQSVPSPAAQDIH